jgi:hypothetical protein
LEIPLKAFELARLILASSDITPEIRTQALELYQLTAVHEERILSYPYHFSGRPRMAQLSPTLASVVGSELAAKRKIGAIKALRLTKGWGLAEAKAIVDCAGDQILRDFLRAEPKPQPLPKPEEEEPEEDLSVKLKYPDDIEIEYPKDSF